MLRLLDPNSLQQLCVIPGLIFVLNKFKSYFYVKTVFGAEERVAHSERTLVFFKSDFWFGFASWLTICLASLVVFSIVLESFFSVSDLASLVVFSAVSESFFTVSDLAFLVLFSAVSNLTSGALSCFRSLVVIFHWTISLFSFIMSFDKLDSFHVRLNREIIMLGSSISIIHQRKRIVGAY